MKSIHYGNPGNINLKGKKTKTLYCGKWAEDDIQNFKEAEREKEDRKEIQRLRGYTKISTNDNKY